jgi:hypothetical protein
MKNPIKQLRQTLPIRLTRVKIPKLTNPVTNLTSLRIVKMLDLKIRIDKRGSPPTATAT